jgi:hypothetical protein
VQNQQRSLIILNKIFVRFSPTVQKKTFLLDEFR